MLPGPSDYNITERHHIPNGTITKSPGHVGLIKDDRNPGPAQYQQLNPTTTAFTIPRSKSQLTIGNNNPGPGEYDSQPGMATLSSKGHKIGNSLRLNLIRKPKPGPGDYNIATELPYRYKGITY